MSKHTTIEQLRKLAQRTKDEIDRIDIRVDNVAGAIESLPVTEDGTLDVITSVKVNGTALPVTDTVVDIGTAIASAVSDAGHLKRKKADSKDAIDLTAADADQYIYMVPNASSDEDDIYDEYLILDGKLEHIGCTKVDISGKVDKVDGKGLSANDYTNDDKAKLDGIEVATDAEVDAMLDEVFLCEESAEESVEEAAADEVESAEEAEEEAL